MGFVHPQGVNGTLGFALGAIRPLMDPHHSVQQWHPLVCIGCHSPPHGPHHSRQQWHPLVCIGCHSPPHGCDFLIYHSLL